MGLPGLLTHDLLLLSIEEEDAWVLGLVEGVLFALEDLLLQVVVVTQLLDAGYCVLVLTRLILEVLDLLHHQLLHQLHFLGQDGIHRRVLVLCWVWSRRGFNWQTEMDSGHRGDLNL